MSNLYHTLVKFKIFRLFVNLRFHTVRFYYLKIFSLPSLVFSPVENTYFGDWFGLDKVFSLNNTDYIT
jgi:hypothetical protein